MIEAELKARVQDPEAVMSTLDQRATARVGVFGGPCSSGGPPPADTAEWPLAVVCFGEGT